MMLSNLKNKNFIKCKYVAPVDKIFVKVSILHTAKQNRILPVALIPYS